MLALLFFARFVGYFMRSFVLGSLGDSFIFGPLFSYIFLRREKMEEMSDLNLFRNLVN